MITILSEIFSPNNILMMACGVASGIMIGALPGLSVIMAIVLLLPMSYGMSSLAGMYLLLGAYCGATYGGSISAILINTPGTNVAAATILDGYPMTQKGKGADALKIALFGSTFGGIFSCIALLFFAPLIAKASFLFGPTEFFALAVFGLAMVANVSGESIFKSIISACLGMMMAVVGIDPIEGVPRLAFGNVNLMGGFNFVAIMLGVFALSEMVINVKKCNSETHSNKIVKSTVKYKQLWKHWKTMIISSLIGLYVGAVPGTGGSIGAFMAYDVAKKMSKHPEEFGQGSEEGLLAPETGNNATTGSALIPMLTLGIPGSAAVAILMSALTLHNIIPGPKLFTENKYWVYCIMIGLIVINVFMFIQGHFLSKLFAKLSSVSLELLIPCVMLLCVIGCYSIRNSTFDVTFLIFATGLGLLFKFFSIPLPPMAIGLVLGNLAETNFRRALVVSNGNYMTFITSPISCVILIITILSLISPLIKKIRNKKKA